VNDYHSWPGRVQDVRFDVLCSFIGIPLKSAHQVLGVIGLSHTEEGKLGDEEIESFR